MARKIIPDQNDSNIQKGKYIDEHSYERQIKDVIVENVSVDRVKLNNKEIIITEVKKSSKFLESASWQLLFYLKTLKQSGVDALGEIHIPEEKKVIKVELNEEKIEKLDQINIEIEKIINMNRPPFPVKVHFCKNCAYYEMCWIF